MSALRRPAAWAWLLLATGLVAFTALGAWQHGRASDKRESQQAWAAALEQAPVALAEVAGDAPRRVRVRGHWLASRYLLDNQVRDGRGGIEVFAPLRSDGGPVLLVALGWLPYADARRELPDRPVLPDGAVDLTGLLAPPPAHGIRMGRDWAQGSDTEKLMPYFALDEIAADAGLALAPQVLRLEPEPGQPYRRDWRPGEGLPPERHLAYAWQWWSLAVAIVIVFVVVHRRPRRAP